MSSEEPQVKVEPEPEHSLPQTPPESQSQSEPQQQSQSQPQRKSTKRKSRAGSHPFHWTHETEKLLLFAAADFPKPVAAQTWDRAAAAVGHGVTREGCRQKFNKLRRELERSFAWKEGEPELDATPPPRKKIKDMDKAEAERVREAKRERFRVESRLKQDQAMAAYEEAMLRNEEFMERERARRERMRKHEEENDDDEEEEEEESADDDDGVAVDGAGATKLSIYNRMLKEQAT